MHANSKSESTSMKDSIPKNGLIQNFRNKRKNVFNRFNYKALGAPDLNVEYANLGSRTFVFIVDLGIVFIFLCILNEFYKLFIPVHSSYKNMEIFFAIGTWYFYKTLFESSIYRATIGMILLKQNIIDLYGNKISFGRASGRWIASLFSILPFGLGFWYATTDSKKRCWHDLISGTYVMKLGKRSI